MITGDNCGYQLIESRFYIYVSVLSGAFCQVILSFHLTGEARPSVRSRTRLDKGCLHSIQRCTKHRRRSIPTTFSTNTRRNCGEDRRQRSKVSSLLENSVRGARGPLHANASFRVGVVLRVVRLLMVHGARLLEAPVLRGSWLPSCRITRSLHCYAGAFKEPVSGSLFLAGRMQRSLPANAVASSPLQTCLVLRPGSRIVYLPSVILFPSTS